MIYNNRNSVIKNQKLQYIMYDKYIYIFERLYENFLILFKKQIFFSFKKNINIEIFNSMIQRDWYQYYSIWDKCFIVVLNLESCNLNVFISLPMVLIRNLLQLYFGNIKYIFIKNIKNIFTASDMYMVKKIVSIIIRCYNDIFKKNMLIKKKYFIYYTFDNFSIFKNIDSELYLNTEFLFLYQIFKFSFNIYLPFLHFKIDENKYFKNLHMKYKKNTNFDKKNKILKNVYNIKLPILFMFKKQRICYECIKNLKLGDVLNLQSIENIIIYTKNKIPIFFGKYIYHKNQVIINKTC